MIDVAEIFLWNTRIGMVRQSDPDRAAVFEYDRDFLRSGVEVSPIVMPLSDRLYSFPGLNNDTFHGLPGLVADSLPDAFGNAVINSWLAKHGRTPESFTAIERLCYMGKRGMGALEYVPAISTEASDGEVDLNDMVELASAILSGRESAVLSEKEASLARLIEIGSSAGGARAKAVIDWNRATGEIRSGQALSDQNFEQWIIKFDGVDKNGDRGISDEAQHTRVEYAYYLMAGDCGVDMEECRLLNLDGRAHFMTKRYDRGSVGKIHVQTLGALAHLDYNVPRCCSYEEYANYARRLGVDPDEMRQIFIRAAFSVAAVNCDDHVKNFSFRMGRNGAWSITPAYDVTFAYAPSNRWLSSHQMTINGKSSEITLEDLLTFGRRIELPAKFCKDAVGRVLDVVCKWMDYAERAGISEDRASAVSGVLRTQTAVR